MKNTISIMFTIRQKMEAQYTPNTSDIIQTMDSVQHNYSVTFKQDITPPTMSLTVYR